MPNLKSATLFAVIISTLVVSGCASIVGQTTNQPIGSSPGLRTAGTVIEDELIENKILVNLGKGSAQISQSHVNVISFNENVLLVGQVPTQTAADEAQAIAKATRRVKTVHNELQIAGPTSFVIRSNDTYLTSRAKVTLLASQNAKGIRVKVITENGTVYLMGLVTRQEAQSAVDEIVNIPGVRKIVKVFEYID
jgi:osmotically-inducible protein OsmY